MTDPDSFAAFIDQARTDGGGAIDVLINNAGVMPVGPFLDHSDAAVRSAVEVNLYGVLTGCRLVLPEMVERRRGQIINIASVAGVVAVPGQALYSATKFAIVGLTTALSDEFAPQGVEISCVLPTFTNTELISGTAAAGATKPVQPENIAAAIVKTIEAENHCDGAVSAEIRRRDDGDAVASRTPLAGPEGWNRPHLPRLRRVGARRL